MLKFSSSAEKAAEIICKIYGILEKFISQEIKKKL
jgi:hypothetical protein